MDALDQVLTQAVYRGQVPGLVAIAVHGDHTLYSTAIGRRALPDGPPMRPDTVFRIASMTKAITATAAMQLVEQGRLSLEASAGSFVEELRAPMVLEGFDAAGQPLLRPARTPITLRHLLTHTAGFAYDIWNPAITRYAAIMGLPPVRSGLLASLKAPLTFDPGERWQYGINIDWVGRMIEAVTDMDLESYFRARIFGPLGMEDTGYEARSHMLPRLATVYARKPDSLQPLLMDPNPPREFFPGGGGLYSTAPDYVRFLRMLLNGGELDGARILKSETVQLMRQNHIGDLLVEPMRSCQPASSEHVEFFPGMAKKWGLSFMINTEPGHAGRNAGSLAWAGLYNTYFWLDAQATIAGVLMTQILPFADRTVLALLDSLEQHAYAIALRSLSGPLSQL
jgi:methyl acetate hydrolase